MKLISEINEEVQIITEGTGANKAYYLEGIFLQGNIKNRNGRVYPIAILDEEVARYNAEFIENNRGFGELGHSAGPTINLERVSHIIKSLKKDGNNYIGKAKIMDTPYGRIVKNLMDEGAKLGVSSRGLGSLDERNGASYVGEDFRLSTAADIVADPSAPDAFVRGIMESKEWVYESGVLKAVEIEEFKKKIHNTAKRRLEEAKLEAFNRLFKNL